MVRRAWTSLVPEDGYELLAQRPLLKLEALRELADWIGGQHGRRRRDADLERVLRGSLVERYKKCGKPGCHCVHSKGHGPALYLSVTLAPGQTRSYYIPEEQRRRIERYLGNYRKLRDVVEEITAINRELLERAALDDEA